MYEALTLKRSNCKNCYKCIRNCPVKAIRFSSNQAHIQPADCILCGQCFVVCPQNAKEIVNDIAKVRQLILSGKKVIASLAPSYIADFEGIGIESMREALKKLGFYDVEETAIGATIVKREYERLIREEKRDILITSCCHTINLLIQKYYPEAAKYLADVLTPMQAHCQDIKRREPDAYTVFIGPCVSKKDEIQMYPGLTDVVLTFEELTEWFTYAGVEPEVRMEKDDTGRARFFPTTGGVLKTMTEFDPEYTYMAMDGIDACRLAIEDILSGNLHHCFIEMSACAGSCIGGPVMRKNLRVPVSEYVSVANYAGTKDFTVSQPEAAELNKKHFDLHNPLPMPSEEEIRKALMSLGKRKPTDELNCGTCGYNTCREKAIAICRGIAEPSMCLPFLKDKAESFSDSIINNSPYGIVVVDPELLITQVNHAALRTFDRPINEYMHGELITELMDPNMFIEVLETHEPVKDEIVYLDEHDKYISLTMTYDEESGLAICIFEDITESQKEKQRKEELTRKTAETADELVAKQMRIVQEIASLLGETTAETKIALTKLKESVENE